MHIHVNLFFFYSFFLDNLYWYWIFGLKFAYLDSISINCAIYFAIFDVHYYSQQNHLILILLLLLAVLTSFIILV
ncbi:hypothetical protein F4703DRAFT_1831580 [Phycomyces blakesleeanus]